MKQSVAQVKSEGSEKTPTLRYEIKTSLYVGKRIICQLTKLSSSDES
jgi:hypothetical protein